MDAAATMREMLQAGVHFGHQTRRWNPHMRPFIFTERHGIHILDLGQTVQLLDTALQQVREVVAGGQKVLFVGTKKQARDTVQQQAERCGMPYVTNRWLGGTLTNWSTISRRIEFLAQIEARIAAGEDEALRKKERLRLHKQYERLLRGFGGLRSLERLPGMAFIIDPTMEQIAVAECNRVRIPVMAMCDTDADPDLIEYPVPSNDDAIRSIQLMTSRVADAVLEGLAAAEVPAPAVAPAPPAVAAPPVEAAAPLAVAVPPVEAAASPAVAAPPVEAAASPAAQPVAEPPNTEPPAGG